MYLENTQALYSYYESRQGAQYPRSVFFGLQFIIKEFLLGKVVDKEKIKEGEDLVYQHFGKQYFNSQGWLYILDRFQGHLPIRIKAIPEGYIVPNNSVMFTVENTDDKSFFLTSFLETLLSQVWASCTVATISYFVKQVIMEYLEQTCDEGKNFGGLEFMLNDFGMRGVTSMMSAGIEGAGHLLSFKSTDTFVALPVAMQYYNADPNSTCFSVAATEHSVMTSAGAEGEDQVIEHLLKQFPSGLLSVVSDSYDVFRLIEKSFGEKFKEKILQRDGKFIVRPDSGDPVETTLKILDILGAKFGYSTNKKGYKVLNPKIGVLWGDGINYDTIKIMLEEIKQAKWSVENVTFGMGSGLLQKINRDVQKFAYKCSAQKIDNQWHGVNKAPLGHPGKASKKGRLKLVYSKEHGFKTVTEDVEGEDLLETVYENGKLVKDWTFEEVKQNLKNSERMT